MARPKRAPAEEPSHVEVENIIPGTELSLGDGRSIAFGERALVNKPLADMLRANKQAR